MGGKKDRYFSDEFKRNAVQLVVEKGLPVRKVALDLNIHPNLLHQWRRIFLDKKDNAFSMSRKGSPEDIELRRLRKELEEVKEERDILKKALAVFAKQNR
jgi:transposase